MIPPKVIHAYKVNLYFEQDSHCLENEYSYWWQRDRLSMLHLERSHQGHWTARPTEETKWYHGRRLQEALERENDDLP